MYNSQPKLHIRTLSPKHKLSVKVTKWVCGTCLNSFCTQTRKSFLETADYRPAGHYSPQAFTGHLFLNAAYIHRKSSSCLQHGVSHGRSSQVSRAPENWVRNGTECTCWGSYSGACQAPSRNAGAETKAMAGLVRLNTEVNATN